MANIGNDDPSTLNSYLLLNPNKERIPILQLLNTVTKERNNLIRFEIKKLLYFSNTKEESCALFGLFFYTYT
jgi:hypothetical protein